jgi:hypothetical protein
MSRTGLALAGISTVGLVLGTSLNAPPAIGATAQYDAFSPDGPAINCGNGLSLVKPNPPASFDPMTADNQQLEEYSYPDRPADPGRLAVWQHFMSNPINWGGPSCDLGPPVSIGPSQSPAPSELSADYTIGAASTPNWTGELDHNNNYTDAEAEWVWPSVTGSNANGQASSTWVSVNSTGSNTHPLIQAGTETDLVDLNEQYYVWFQAYGPGDEPDQIPASGFVHGGPGNLMSVHVNLVNNSEGVFHIVDISIGVDETFKYLNPSITTDGHAEFITERTEECNEPSFSPNCVYPRLAAFGTVEFTGAQVYSPSSGWLYAEDSDHLNVTMYNCGSSNNGGLSSTILAEPGGWRSASDFTNVFEQMGSQSPDGCG